MCITHVPGTVTNQFRDPIFFIWKTPVVARGTAHTGARRAGGSNYCARSSICMHRAVKPNGHTMALLLGTLGNAPTVCMPLPRASTAFSAPGIWECWRLFLVCSVGLLIWAFICRLYRIGLFFFTTHPSGCYTKWYTKLSLRHHQSVFFLQRFVEYESKRRLI
jgi:hypothetical protein